MFPESQETYSGSGSPEIRKISVKNEGNDEIDEAGAILIEINGYRSVLAETLGRIIHQFPPSDVLDGITSSDEGYQAQIKALESLPLDSMECAISHIFSVVFLLMVIYTRHKSLVKIHVSYKINENLKRKTQRQGKWLMPMLFNIFFHRH